MRTGCVRDKQRLLPFLSTDRLYAAYAIADLSPGYFERSEWAVAHDADGIQALALHYQGLDPPALFLMGGTEGVEAILAREMRPGRVYLTCRDEHLTPAGTHYRWERLEPMWRMSLRRSGFRPEPGDCDRLTIRDLQELMSLYALGGADAFAPEQLEHGVFFGIRRQGGLVAAAGTHVISHDYSLAAVGNVFTHPAHRGHSFAKATTSAVLAELFAQGMADVVLNVSRDNAPAVAAYEKLGFGYHCGFLEARAMADDPLEARYGR